jgi:hypothetical protein
VVVDLDRSRVDSLPATITEQSISWHDPKQGFFDLDRVSGQLDRVVEVRCVVGIEKEMHRLRALEKLRRQIVAELMAESDRYRQRHMRGVNIDQRALQGFQGAIDIEASQRKALVAIVWRSHEMEWKPGGNSTHTAS